MRVFLHRYSSLRLRRRAWLSSKIAALAAALFLPTFALAASGDTSLVVMSRASSTAAEGSGQPVMSSNGRFVVFPSTAPNLVEGDDNLEEDVFLFDRASSAVLRVEDPWTCPEVVGRFPRITSASVSRNGRFVMWATHEICILDDGVDSGALFLWDRQTDARRTVDSGTYKLFSSPRMSDDSKWIAYVSRDASKDDLDEVRLYSVESGTSVLVSKGSSSFPTGHSNSPAISSDGRLIAFASEANDLVPNDSNQAADIFLYDRSNSQIARISRSNAGVQGNGASGAPAITADGALIAYSSEASNLVTGDTNDASDIFVFNMSTQRTSRASRTGANGQLNGPSTQPSISSDGRFVVFSSSATNVVTSDSNSAPDIFMRDRQAATTSRLSTAGGAEANGPSFDPSISADGRYVAYQSDATNLTDNDRNRDTDIYLLDRQGATLFLADPAAKPIAGLEATASAVSRDGTKVAFDSTASSLVPHDTNGRRDVFVRDYSTGAVSRVSRPTGDGEGDFDSSEPSINKDGRFVAFMSSATNLVPGDTNVREDVFVRDRLNRTTVRANVSSTGEQSAWPTRLPRISGNGHHVVFYSRASNFYPGDDELTDDVFVRDLTANLTEHINADENAARRNFDVSVSPAISDSGRYVVLASRESLEPGDTSGDMDAYLRDRQSGKWERVSVPVGDAPDCCSRIWAVDISSSGRYVVFASDSPNLVPGDTNNKPDVFLRDRQLHTTVLASIFPSATDARNRRITEVSISDDGRFVSIGLFAWDTPFTGFRPREVFVRDMERAIAKRVSVNSEGVAANADADHSSISGDGRFVVFTSPATNLVAEPLTSGTVFLHER